jgi:hypothetical protein
LGTFNIFLKQNYYLFFVSICFPSDAWCPTYESPDLGSPASQEEAPPEVPRGAPPEAAKTPEASKTPEAAKTPPEAAPAEEIPAEDDETKDLRGI